MPSAFHMVDVGSKTPTHRIAIAEGTIYVGAKAFALIKTRSLPKGDALILAEMAGIQGAKQASQTIPLCHPMGLDHIAVTIELDEPAQAVRVFCMAAAHARTGVEMEVLAGVNAALLAVWDLAKMVEPDLRIEGVRLLAKKGGKSGLWLNPAGAPDWVLQKINPPSAAALAGITTAVITLSDRAAAGVYEDRSGPLAKSLLEAVGASVTETVVIPDDGETLKEKILAIKRRGDTRLVITSGGTGVAPRDCTPETIMVVADRVIPGIGELLRQYGAQFTPFSWSSRSLAATLGDMLIIALPGNPKAVREGIECLCPHLGHLARTLDDIKHD